MRVRELKDALLNCETTGEGLRMIRETLDLSQPMSEEVKTALANQLGKAFPGLDQHLLMCRSLHEMVCCIEMNIDTTIPNSTQFVESFMKLVYVMGIKPKHTNA